MNHSSLITDLESLILESRIANHRIAESPNRESMRQRDVSHFARCNINGLFPSQGDRQATLEQEACYTFTAADLSVLRLFP